MKKLLLFALLPALALCSLADARDLSDPNDLRDLNGRWQFFFVKDHGKENPKGQITIRITEVATYYSGDTTGDFYYIFKAEVISSDLNEPKEKEIIDAYFQKERLGRKFAGPEEIKANDTITVSVREIRDEAIICVLIKTIRSNKAVDTTAVSARLLHNETSKLTKPDAEATSVAAAVSP